MKDLIIIGLGPAGVSASLYAKSRGLDILCLEKNKIGGMIEHVSKVSHYSGISEDETGKSLSKKFKNQLDSYDIEYKFEEVIDIHLENDIKTIKTKKQEFKAKAVIIATGTKIKMLDIKTDEHKYISFDPSANKHKIQNKEIFVFGGSDGAVKEALYLSEFANLIHLVQIGDKLLCIDEFKNKLNKKENIKIHLSTTAKSINPKKIVLINPQTQEETKFITEDEYYVFSYIGLVGNSDIFKQYFKINNSFIDSNIKTDYQGVYIAGDVRVKDVRQISSAVNDGMLASILAQKYIEKK